MNKTKRSQLSRLIFAILFTSTLLFLLERYTALFVIYAPLQQSLPSSTSFLTVSSIIPTRRIALFFLTRQIQVPLLLFLQSIASCDIYDIYVVVDDYTDASDIDVYHDLGYHDNDSIIIIQYRDDELKELGYSGMNYGGGMPSAWDKAWYANTVDPRYAYKYDYVYWIEDDVFIPSIHTLVNLTQSVQNAHTPPDLIISEYLSDQSDPEWSWWDVYRATSLWPILKLYDATYKSTLCAFGMSRKYLHALHKFHTTVAKVTNIVNEFSIPSIAAYYGLVVYIPQQFNNTIIFRNTATLDEQWHMNDIAHTNDSVMHLYHPVKDQVTQNKYRAELFRQYNINNKCPN